MVGLTVSETVLPGVLIIEPEIFEDARGFFYESFNAREFNAKTGLDCIFVQDNHSRSSYGVLRGLHYQISNAQGKLVRVTKGAVFDVAVDIREGAPTFGQWVAVELSAENKRQLWVPENFAHGFLVTSPLAEVQYKTTDYYAPIYEKSIRWDDPSIGIKWPDIGKNPSLSGKDTSAYFLRDAPLPVFQE